MISALHASALSASSCRASFVSAASTAASTSVVLPAHQAGDLILVIALSTSQATVSIPAAGGTVPTWNAPAASSGGSLPGVSSCRFQWAIATGSSTTSGTWTNANRLAAFVFRNVHQTSPLVANGTSNTTGTTPSMTLNRTDQTSQVLYAFCGFGTSPGFVAIADHTTRTSGALYTVTKNVPDSAPALDNTNFNGRYAVLEIKAP